MWDSKHTPIPKVIAELRQARQRSTMGIIKSGKPSIRENLVMT